MKKILGFAVILLLSYGVKAQVTNSGKLFYMTYPEVGRLTTSPTVDSFVLYFSSLVNTTVKIEVHTFSPISIQVKAGQIASYNLKTYNTTAWLDNKVNGVKENKRSIKVTSNDPITLYAMAIEEYKTDGTFVMPYEAIPTNPTFIIGSYFSNDNRSGSYAPCEFSIVAMDNVTVRIKPSCTTADGKVAGTNYYISLGRGQVYQIQTPRNGTSGISSGSNNTAGAITNPTVGDLTGTIVQVVGTNCGKINVFSGSVETMVPYRNCNSSDYLLSQNFPTSVLGKEYVLAPFRTHTLGYAFRVIASEKNTKVWVDGTLVTTLTDTGKIYSENVTTAVGKLITADKPIYVLQFMKTDACASSSSSVTGDPAIIATPTIQQLITRATVAAPRTGRINNFNLNIITKVSAKNAVLLNGVPVASSSFVNIGTSGFCYTQQQILSKPYSIRCDSGMIAVTYGLGDRESYAYCAGATFENLNYDINIQKTGRCPNQPITMKAILQGSYSSIQWDFGDGTSDTGKTVVHSYKESGAFIVNMKVKQDLSCGKIDSNIRSRTIIVDGANPGFPDSTKICASKVNLTLDATYTPNYKYTWQDGSTNQLFNVTTPGKYKVVVFDTLSKCSVTDSTLVVRYDTLIGNIGFDTLQPCIAKNRFALSDYSNYTNDGFKKAHWQVTDENGDLVEYTTKKIGFSFTKLGTYPVYYKVESIKGCVGYDTIDLNVYDMPIAKMSIDDTIKCTKVPFTFTDSSSDAVGIFASFWNFGNTVKDTGLVVTYAYPTSDTFAVRLITSNTHGCRDTADSTVIAKPLPVAAITHSATNYCRLTHSLQFNDNTSDASGSWTRTWYKDKVTAGTSNPITNIKYSDSGTHTMGLAILNNYGCRDSATYTLKIYREPKAAIAITDSAICIKGNYFDIESSSTAAKGENFTYSWKLSDSTSYAINKFKKSFAYPGSKTLKLIVTTNRNCKDSVSRNVQIYTMPTASFTIDKTLQCLKNNIFKFTINNTPAAGSNLIWTMGDGAAFSTASPSHTYADTGNKTTRLIITDAQGCKDSFSTKHRVTRSAASDFTSSHDSMCLGTANIQYTHRPGPVKYSTNWDFGTYGSSTQLLPSSINYTAAGNFTTRLITTVESICSDTSYKTIKIFGIPTANFTVNKPDQCEDENNFIITNTSSTNGANGVTYEWTLTPPGTVVIANAYGPLVLPNVGPYALVMQAISNRGCKTNTNRTMNLHPSPSVSITGENQCKGEPVAFTHITALSSGSIANYNWDFGDGGTSNVIPGEHTYINSGTYNISLQVVSDQNCRTTSAPISVQIFDRPVASYTGTYLTSRGIESDYEFVSTSTGASNLQWTYNKLSDIDVTPKVQKTFLDTGDLRVQLWVSNSAGCADSITQRYILKPQLLYHVPNSFSPDDDGLNEVFRGSTDYGMENYLLTVFDRWGGVIFRTNKPSEGWNGRFNNTDDKVPDGVYAYSITFLYFDGTFHKYTGALHIIR